MQVDTIWLSALFVHGKYSAVCKTYDMNLTVELKQKDMHKLLYNNTID